MVETRSTHEVAPPPVDDRTTRNTVLEYLNAARDALVARAGASSARQVRWVVDELVIALDTEEFPDPGSVGELFAPASVRAYLDLASAGRLRRVRINRPEQPSARSTKVRMTVLRKLAEELAVPKPALANPLAAPRPVVPAPARSALQESLATLVDRGGDGERVRLLAMVGVVLDSGARVGELCAMTAESLSPRMDALVLGRRPQSGRSARVEEWALSGPSRAALVRWLEVRRGLLAAVEGAASALWVSTRANHAGLVDERGAVGRPPGMPLQVRGAGRAYTRGVERANIDLAGTPGWAPLPTRLEQLRRGVLESRPGRSQSSGLAPVSARPQDVDPSGIARALADVVYAAEAVVAVTGAADGADAELALFPARDELDRALRRVWALGAGHTVLLRVLAQAGVGDVRYVGVLLDAVTRAAGRGPR